MRIGHDPQAITIADPATAVKRVSSDMPSTSGISRIGEARTVVSIADAATAVKRAVRAVNGLRRAADGQWSTTALEYTSLGQEGELRPIQRPGQRENIPPPADEQVEPVKYVPTEQRRYPSVRILLRNRQRNAEGMLAIINGTQDQRAFFVVRP